MRDTDAWDPRRYDQDAARQALGIVGKQIVMFLGTPRSYKGIDDLIEAVRRLGDDVVLVLIGADPTSEATQRWRELAWVKMIGHIPFDALPRYLIAADVVAVPQRATTDTLGQVPAKIFDAMALARPVVATSVSMIPEILQDCGIVVPPGDVAALVDGLRRILADRDAAERLGQRGRERCIAEYSFTAARARLFPLFERVAGDGGR